MTAGGDEVQVAADGGLGGVDVAEIVGAVDDPELPVARGEIQNLLVLGQNDERRHQHFGMNRNNILSAEFPAACAGTAWAGSGATRAAARTPARIHPLRAS